MEPRMSDVGVSIEAVTQRSVLPMRRVCETFEYEHNGVHFTASIGRANAAAPVNEIFLNTKRLSSGLDSVVRDAAVAISLALQFGCPLHTLAKAMTREGSGTPNSPLGHLLDSLSAE